MVELDAGRSLVRRLGRGPALRGLGDVKRAYERFTYFYSVAYNESMLAISVRCLSAPSEQRKMI